MGSTSVVNVSMILLNKNWKEKEKDFMKSLKRVYDSVKSWNFFQNLLTAKSFSK